MKIVDFSSVVFRRQHRYIVKSGKGLFTFDNMAGKNIGVIAAQRMRGRCASTRHGVI